MQVMEPPTTGSQTFGSSMAPAVAPDGIRDTIKSSVEVIDGMLEDLNLLSVLKNGGGDLSKNRTVTKNQLWNIITVAYSALKTTPTQSISAESVGASEDTIEERLLSFKNEMMETITNTMATFADSFKATTSQGATSNHENGSSRYADIVKGKPVTNARLTLSGESAALRTTDNLLTETPTTYYKKNTDGSVVYGFKSAAELKQATEKISQAKMDVKLQPYVSKPLLTIRNAEVSFIPSDCEGRDSTDKLILESIRVLNDDVARALNLGESMEVVYFQRHRGRSDLATVGLKVTRPLCDLMLNKGHIHVGHFLCPVERRYAVKQCYKCQGFGHVLKDCKSVSPKCFRCAGDHFGRDCDKRAKEYRKCSNCAESTNHLIKSGAMSHNAASIECPVLLQHVNSKN